VIVHVHIVLGNNCVGDLAIACLHVDDKVFERGVDNYLEVHVQFQGQLAVNLRVGTVQGHEHLQITQVSITYNNALLFVETDGSVSVVFLELYGYVDNNIGTVFHLEFRENLG